MNLTLIRKEFRPDGVFGEMTDPNSDHFFFTVEHSYPDGESFKAKVAAGNYRCKRGEHKLHDGISFITFELENVPPFNGNSVTDILIHKGNYNKDSEGCILIGLGFGRMTDGGRMITSSKQAFEKFMLLQEGQDEFVISIIE